MIEKLIRSNIKDIPPYVPGKSKEEIAREFGLDPDKIIKLASNENPLGPPKTAIGAIGAASSKIAVYPDAIARDLTAELSRYVGMEEEQIIAGNGSDEILDLAVRLFIGKGDEAVISTPTFSVYESLVRIASGTPVFVPLKKDSFEYNICSILEKINKKTKLVFICSPNNPTGNLISEDDVREILETEVIVLVDEAYTEFCGCSFIDLINEYDNLIVIRTFSKAFGLAGLRVGYGIACKKIIDYMFRIKIPFTVNTLAQKAAITALKDGDHLKTTIETTEKGRDYLFFELSKIDSIKVYPSNANFILVNVKGTGKTAAEIAEELFKNGIIVRDCRKFRGLDEYHLRVSIGTMEENLKFLEMFRESISE